MHERLEWIRKEKQPHTVFACRDVTTGEMAAFHSVGIGLESLSNCGQYFKCPFIARQISGLLDNRRPSHPSKSLPACHVLYYNHLPLHATLYNLTVATTYWNKTVSAPYEYAYIDYYSNTHKYFIRYLMTIKLKWFCATRGSFEFSLTVGRNMSEWELGDFFQ
jgi:hypothetical protein